MPLLTEVIFQPHSVIHEGTADISLDLSPDYFHALGATHGAVYFKLLDDAAFFAAQSMITDYFILTTHFELDLLRPVESGTIMAKGNFIGFEGNTVTAMATLYNQANKCIGKGVGTFMRSRKLLQQVAGYNATG